MEAKKTLIVDNKEITLEGERNLLEVIRKANIDLPTFCYHSELSIYGACRLCTVELEGRGLVAACSLPPEAGMVVNTNTKRVNRLRKVNIELLLANHESDCTTCGKSTACKLQDLAKRFGVKDIRFKKITRDTPKDISSPSIVRDPDKCILCGDCVRMCDEVQGIGAIDFAGRGHDTMVLPAFGKDLNDVECVFCGQCARVCPTGALVPKHHIDNVWNAIFNTNKTVVAQIAPAVRVALGEEFGLEPGTNVTGKAVAALKLLGFDQIHDTAFAADLTIMEEGTEFLNRVSEGKNLPQFTSCCPGWVKTAEQYFPDLLDNLSTCKSPQQMFGSVAKEVLPKKIDKDPKDIYVVSIMPCTAKKFEAKRPEFSKDGDRDIDCVLTTQEFAQMIKEKGIDLNNLLPESFDMPFGFKTGAGVLFANSGGVTEAALRFAVEVLEGKRLENVDFKEVRGESGLREANLEVAGMTVKIAIVHGLANAKKVAQDVKDGKSPYHLIEVMACPGGCIGGAGQPVSFDPEIRQKRTTGIFNCDKMLELHKSQDNPYIKSLYEEDLGEVGGKLAHKLLHTHYQFRKRDDNDGFVLVDVENPVCDIAVCVGTNCYLKGSQDILHKLIHFVQENDLDKKVRVKATFCVENCGHAPNVSINDEIISKADYDTVVAKIKEITK